MHRRGASRHTCSDTEAGDGTFAQSAPSPWLLCGRQLAHHTLAEPQCRPSLRHHFRPFHRLRPQSIAESRVRHARRTQHSTRQRHTARLPQSLRASPRFRPIRPALRSTPFLRAGVGIYYNDLAQNGWVDAFTAVNQPISTCVAYDLSNPACLRAAPTAARARSSIRTTARRTRCRLGAAFEQDFAKAWRLSLTYQHQQGVHQYRRYEFISGFSLPDDSPTSLCSAPTIAPATTVSRSSSSIISPIALSSPPTTSSPAPPPGAPWSANSSITSTESQIRATPSARRPRPLRRRHPPPLRPHRNAATSLAFRTVHPLRSLKAPARSRWAPPPTF